MNRNSAKKYRFHTSSLFFEIGNSLNLSKLIKWNAPKIVRDYQDSLAEDWNVVGEEVAVAIDKFERIYGIKPKTREDKTPVLTRK